MKLSEFLVIAKSKIDSENKWCQGSCAINVKGFTVLAIDSSACRFCAAGAIISGIDEKCEKLSHELLEEIIKKDSNHANLVEFNDSSTHKQVMELWDKAIAKALEQESLTCA